MNDKSQLKVREFILVMAGSDGLERLDAISRLLRQKTKDSVTASELACRLLEMGLRSIENAVYKAASLEDET